MSLRQLGDQKGSVGGGQGGDISIPAQEGDPGGQPEYVGL